MLWLKAFHIIAMVCWFAGIFYLPRIFVYHADLPLKETGNYDRFCVMERRLFWGIMTPSAILTLILGVGLVHVMKLSFSSPPLWLSLKLLLVILLMGYHVHCGILVKKFKMGKNPHTSFYYRVYNEISVLILIGIVLLVVLKPT